MEKPRNSEQPIDADKLQSLVPFLDQEVLDLAKDRQEQVRLGLIKPSGGSMDHDDA